jgi:hypothetical protein
MVYSYVPLTVYLVTLLIIWIASRCSLKFEEIIYANVFCYILYIASHFIGVYVVVYTIFFLLFNLIL